MPPITALGEGSAQNVCLLVGTIQAFLAADAPGRVGAELICKGLGQCAALFQADHAGSVAKRSHAIGLAIGREAMRNNGELKFIEAGKVYKTKVEFKFVRDENEIGL